MIDRSFKGPDSAKQTIRQIVLPKESELRIRVEFDQSVYVKVSNR